MNHFNFRFRPFNGLLAFFLIIGMVSCSTRPYRLKRAETLYRQGQLYSSKGEFKKAYAKFEESLAVAK
ncbi:MAG: tetratricopeptide repeat-containing protein, partial [Deltaproteobacteria bacterium]|nr:tetratricopeptide repeat-containing protein [Deltaproteobacteria bacterium]